MDTKNIDAKKISSNKKYTVSNYTHILTVFYVKQFIVKNAVDYQLSNNKRKKI